MSVTLSEAVKELFQGKNFAHVATLMPDGSPQVSPVWVEFRDGRIVFNTAEVRLKVDNLRRDPALPSRSPTRRTSIGRPSCG
ncbi:MAG: pyridoxamine 5'-phosphate oxidase family protein, partial [Dehalococcoidia bacterium]